MTRHNEEYLFNTLEQIKQETHENNKMLRQIIKVINTYLLNHNNENNNDFNRNILANLISNIFDVRAFSKGRNRI